jgi:hypothetical protein
MAVAAKEGILSGTGQMASNTGKSLFDNRMQPWNSTTIIFYA